MSPGWAFEHRVRMDEQGPCSAVIGLVVTSHCVPSKDRPFENRDMTIYILLSTVLRKWSGGSQIRETSSDLQTQLPSFLPGDPSPSRASIGPCQRSPISVLGKAIPSFCNAVVSYSTQKPFLGQIPSLRVLFLFLF